MLDLLCRFKSTAGEKYRIEQLALFGSATRSEQCNDSDMDSCVKPRYIAEKEDLELIF